MKELPRRWEVEQEMEKNRNHSWYREVYEIHKDELDKVALKYLGTDITYKEFFDESFKWAKSLKANGVKKGDEFVICLDRTPEATYLICAASIIGAKIKLISDKFNPEFIKSNVLESDSSLFFVQDVKLAKMKDILSDLPNIKVVPVSHERSLNKDFPYLYIFGYFYNLDEEQYRETVKELTNIYSLEEFLNSGNDYTEEVEEISTLDDDFTITYSSGTTKRGQPKGIVHSNRHYILMGRYHDPKVSGVPAMKNLATYSNVPIYSNSYVASSLSDNLIQGGIVVLDPVDDPVYFSIALKMHQSNINIATTSTWLLNAIKYYTNNENEILPDAMFNFAVGEQLSSGEEKFLNKYLKDVKAGINVTHTPVSLSKMSVAGGDCEHGSLFIRLLRSYYNKLVSRSNYFEPIGMSVYDFVDIVVLREDGTWALPYEIGRIVCNSRCTMKRYDKDPEATSNFYVVDAYGILWGDMNVYGYLDDKGNVTMKGRLSKDKSNLPPFMIADVISKDTKNIMSCEVVEVEHNGENVYVAHIMPQLNIKINYEKIVDGIKGRCSQMFSSDIMDRIYLRFRTVNDNYPRTSCEKRDVKVLQQEGLRCAHKLNMIENNKTEQTGFVRKKTKDTNSI